MKRFNPFTTMLGADLIVSKVISGWVSIDTFASGADLTVGIAPSGASLLFSLATAITRKSFKIFSVKQEKHDAIKLLVQSKLDNIADTILQVMQDGDISSIEFHKILQEKKKYLKLNADIRNQEYAISWSKKGTKLDLEFLFVISIINFRT